MTTDLRHVHIIHEYEETSSRRRAVRVLGTLLDVSLQVTLDIHGGSSR